MDSRDGRSRLARRMETMLLPTLSAAPLDLLDLGCGPGLMLDLLQAQGRLDRLTYHGIDLSPLMISHAQRRWPGWSFELRDIIVHPLTRMHDYTVINGVLTYKGPLSFEEMERFAHRLLKQAWEATSVCLSFNVMSTHVDHQRQDLFHWSMEGVMQFCRQMLARNVVIMSDYGLYEYTVHVFRSERKEAFSPPPAWSADDA